MNSEEQIWHWNEFWDLWFVWQEILFKWNSILSKILKLSLQYPHENLLWNESKSGGISNLFSQFKWESNSRLVLKHWLQLMQTKISRLEKLKSAKLSNLLCKTFSWYFNSWGWANFLLQIEQKDFGSSLLAFLTKLKLEIVFFKAARISISCWEIWLSLKASYSKEILIEFLSDKYLKKFDRSSKLSICFEPNCHFAIIISLESRNLLLLLNLFRHNFGFSNFNSYHSSVWNWNWTSSMMSEISKWRFLIIFLLSWIFTFWNIFKSMKRLKFYFKISPSKKFGKPSEAPKDFPSCWTAPSEGKWAKLLSEGLV